MYLINNELYIEEAAIDGEEASKEENEKMLNFCKGADILIHDAQYTAEEYEKHLGWGHSSYNYAMKVASQSNVKKLVFFHHDPNYKDKKLESIEEQCKNDARDKPGFEIIMAREGLKIEI